MTYYLIPQFLINGGRAGSVFFNTLAEQLAADWTGRFGVAPYAASGPDYWRLFQNYNPGDQLIGGATPRYTSATLAAALFVLSGDNIANSLDYATLTLAITGGMDVGQYTIFYDHTFSNKRLGSSQPSFCAISDWNVFATVTNIVQNRDGSMAIPFTFIFTTTGATVTNSSLYTYRNTTMRYQAGSPGTDAQAVTAIVFGNVSGGLAPVANPYYIFNANIVTVPTPMTITFDTLVPVTAAIGPYGGLLVNKTATATVTVYPFGTVLVGGGGTGGGGGGGTGPGNPGNPGAPGPPGTTILYGGQPPPGVFGPGSGGTTTFTPLPTTTAMLCPTPLLKRTPLI